MKSKFLVLSAALIASAAIFSSFNQSETATGSITVTVTHDGHPAKEALVGVSKSEEDRDNSVYIHEEEANEAGVIKFSSIAPGKYYLDAADEDYYGEAEVTVGDGNVDVKIILTDIEEEDED